MSRFLFSLANEYVRLAKPVLVGGIRTDEREIAYVAAAGLQDPDYPSRVGEAAPLPGLHTETLDEVMDAFEGEAQDAVFADSLEDCDRMLADEPPSLRFALESIWLGWRAYQQDTVPARVLRADARDHVDVCALVDAAPDADVPDGTRAVKVKVGRLGAEREREALHALLARLGPDVEIRLDANRAWSLDEAVARLQGVDPARIAFIEEPLVDPTQLPALYARTGVPVALDESLHEAEFRALWDEDAVAAFVVKPSRCGIYRTLSWDAHAVAQGKRVVVSSCFESGVGLSMLAQIAAALRSDGGPAGLGTMRWFDPVPEIVGYDIETQRFATDEWTPA